MWAESICEGLKSSGIGLLAHVPDMMIEEILKCARADSFFDILGVTREEEGVGVLSGLYLGGKRGALLMQNSGLGNSIGAMASFCVPFQVPFLMIISQRGELGEFNPCQVPMGKSARPVLDALGIQHFTLEDEAKVAGTVAGAARLAYASHMPVALFVSTSLSGGKQG